MKTQKKNGQGLYLQKKNNNRWKWMAGATAATAAAGVTASQASTITINLLGNYISATGGNHLNADLTGDGQADVTIANTYFFNLKRTIGTSTTFYLAGARAYLNGVVAYAFSFGDGGAIGVVLGSQFRSIRYITQGPYYGSSLTGSIPITFKDMNINGGALTKGSLLVTVSTNFAAGFDPKVQLDSFTYNTRENVPDQGSSLALLALGASGVLALRRLRTAQKDS